MTTPQVSQFENNKNAVTIFEGKLLKSEEDCTISSNGCNNDPSSEAYGLMQKRKLKEESESLTETPRSYEKRKRVRTTTVTQACNNCRDKHLKCDGVFPICTRCQKRGSVDPCTYKAIRLKRGPTPGKGKKPDQSANPIVPSPVYSLMVEKTKKLDDLNFATLSSEYLRQYLTYYAPIVEIFPPDIQLDHLFKFDNEQSILTLNSNRTNHQSLIDVATQMLMALCIGAQGMGKQSHSEYFANAALSLLSEQSERSQSITTAGNYFLLALFYFSSAKTDKAASHNYIAIDIIKRQLAKYGNTAQLLKLYCCIMYQYADFCPVRSEQIQVLDTIIKLYDTHEALNSSSKYYKIFAIARKVWLQMTWNPKQDIKELIRSLQECEENIPSNANAIIKKEVQAIVTSCCSAVLHLSGVHELATKCALSVLTDFEDITHNYSPLAIVSLVTTSQVLFYENHMDKFQQSLIMMEQVAKFYPCAGFVLKNILEPLSTGKKAPQSMFKSKYDLYYAKDLEEMSTPISIPTYDFEKMLMANNHLNAGAVPHRPTPAELPIYHHTTTITHSFTPSTYDPYIGPHLASHYLPPQKEYQPINETHERPPSSMSYAYSQRTNPSTFPSPIFNSNDPSTLYEAIMNGSFPVLNNNNVNMSNLPYW